SLYFYRHAVLLFLHSFPTRRSSDLVFLDGIAPCAVDFTRGIFAFLQALDAEFVSQLGNLRIDDDLLHQVRRYENDPAFFGQYGVSRQDGSSAYADGNIDPCQHHIFDEGWVLTLIPGIETLDFGQAGHVADPTVEYHAPFGFCINGVTQIVADQGTVNDFPIPVCYIDIAFLQDLNRP